MSGLSVILATRFLGKPPRGKIPVFVPPRGKTNNVVSDQVRHKPTCTETEAG